MTVAALASTPYEVDDAFAANELFQSKGWTDGLPIVPPTPEGVRAFLDAGRCAPVDVVGAEPVRRRRITAEKVAIAALMAGCLPEYMPPGAEAACAGLSRGFVGINLRFWFGGLAFAWRLLLKRRYFSGNRRRRVF